MLRRSPRIANLAAVDYRGMGNGSPLHRRRRLMVRRQQAPPLGPSVLYNPLHSSASAGSGAQDNEGGTNPAPQMFHTDFADNEPENAGTKRESAGEENNHTMPNLVGMDENESDDSDGMYAPPVHGDGGVSVVRQAGQDLTHQEFSALSRNLFLRIPPQAGPGILFQMWLPFLGICREVFGSVLSEGQLERLLVPVFELTGWEAPMRVPGLADAGFEVWVHSHAQLVYTLILAVRQVLSLPSVRTEVMGALYGVLIDMSDVLGQGMPMEGE
ncbi:hypothetical protein PLESTB_001758400 [Pleodorina starrii]|uniref:Uncharacterized protein n=1 Tax=Pleodorina starrii TaxID=330485 RepID=A0A9W6C049_9CHLO|nr:hypothetical protein PLESTM_000600100 [Pleodorina starrii]GLC61457.1 hypothetical protein PLESTB_001758400 [Pleodorina starrii]GLC74097.1 hypothetical protein PLESTF_001459500 [Pleodorina starrii]